MGSTPYWFKCSKCKRTRGELRLTSRGKSYLEVPHGEPVLTGRAKVVKRTTDGKLNQKAVEYRCKKCGFVGWTRHPSMVQSHARLRSGDGT